MNGAARRSGCSTYDENQQRAVMPNTNIENEYRQPVNTYLLDIPVKGNHEVDERLAS